MFEEELDAGITDAHGGWTPTGDVLTVDEVVEQFLFGDEVRRFVVMLDKLTHGPEIGFLFASMAQVIGEKEGKSMKTKTKYTEEPMGDLKIVKDFLPPPDQLVLREDNVKVTISLKKSSITFFKEQAKKQKTSYQKMIREVVDWYASHYQKSA